MTDFNTLVSSDNIEDKLKAVQDSACSAKVIAKMKDGKLVLVEKG